MRPAGTKGTGVPSFSGSDQQWNQAIKKGAQTIWMQEGIVHNDAAKKARDSGLRVVMDKCMMKEHIASSKRHPDNV